MLLLTIAAPQPIPLGVWVMSWVNEINGRQLSFERRVGNIEHKLAKPPEAAESQGENAGPDGEVFVGPEYNMLRTRPEVRECNWDMFKNRYPRDQEICTIEVLLDCGDLIQQMEADQLKRTPEEKRKTLEATRRETGRRAQPEKKTEARMLDRIRINSAIVLGFLSKVAGAGRWTQNPHTFLKPFKILIHFQDKMKDELEDLRRKFEDEREDEPKTASEDPEVNEPDVTEDTCRPEEDNMPDDTTCINSHEPLPGDAAGTLRPKLSLDVNPSPYDEQHSAALNDDGKQAKAMQNGQPVFDNAVFDNNNNNSDNNNNNNNTTPQIISDVPSPETRFNGRTNSRFVDDSLSFLDNPELEKAMHSRRAYDEMKFYVDFVEETLIRKMYAKFNVGTDGTQPTKVRYDELWYLFRPGDLVYEESTRDSGMKHLSHEDHHMKAKERKLWRLYHIVQDTPHWVVNDLFFDDPGDQLRGKMQVQKEFTNILAYHLDFDGTNYAAVSRKFTIERFEGEMAITKLPVHPIRFVKDHVKILADFRQRGERFRELTARKQSYDVLSHQGWTLTRNPVGEAIEDHAQDHMASHQYIESDVVVDFHETLQVCPWWKPNFQKAGTASFSPQTVEDEYDINRWSVPDSKGRSGDQGFITDVTDVVLANDSICMLEWETFMESDKFLVDLTEGQDFDDTKQELSRDDLALLPARVFVYALRNRLFINADIQNIKDIPTIENPFSELKISEDYKTLVQSVVHDHLRKKEVQRRATALNFEYTEQDIIRGKGKGLVILLQGEPGVGKTATAEVIAHFYKKPLFPITCADLGTESNEIENNMEKIFRLANLWDCILLLDEAEIFLAQRDKKDDNLQKNIMVSSKSLFLLKLMLTTMC